MREIHCFSVILRRTATLAFIAFSCLGCNRPPDHVHFVVPDGFLGSFAVQHDDPDGIELRKADGRYILHIPETRVLKIKGYFPFARYLKTASFASGRPIWVEKSLGDAPGADDIAIWGGESKSWNEGSKLVSQSYWFVGTQEQWKAANSNR